MKKKLGNYIIAAFIINVFAIMSVGGVCIMLVNDMVNNISSLEKESEDVSKIDDIDRQKNSPNNFFYTSCNDS